MWFASLLFLLFGLATQAWAVTPTSIGVSWPEPTLNTDGSQLTNLSNYRVYYSTNQTPCPNASTVQIVTAPLASPPANHSLSTTLNNLTSSTTYFVSVTAVNAFGQESACSQVSSLATLAAQPPLNVTNLALTFAPNPKMSVTRDANATAPHEAVNSTTNDLTALTVGSGANRALIAQFVTAVDPGASVTAVWDQGGSNQSMTLIGTATAAGGERCYLFGLVNPVAGNKTLRVTTTNGINSILNATSYLGVDQTGGTTSFAHFNSATGTTTTVSVTITSAVGNMTVDCFAADTATGTPTKTLLWFLSGTSTDNGGSSEAVGAASNVHQWTIDVGTGWATVGVDIVAAPSGVSQGSSSIAFHPGKGPTFARFFQTPRGSALSPDIAAGQGSVSTSMHPGARPTRGAPGIFFQSTKGFTFDLSLLTPPAGLGSESTNIHPGKSPGVGRFFQTKGGITAIVTAGPTPVGQALETDVSQPVTHLKTLAVGQALETDVAQPLTVNKSITVTQPIETDIAQPVGRLKTKLVGQALETDVAQAVTRNKALTVTQPVETDIAQPVAWNPKNRLANQAVETDIAQPVTAILGSGATTLQRTKRKHWFRSGS